MASILTINTALESASVQLGEAVRTNNSQKDHASWIHLAIKEVLEQQSRSVEELDAVAVVAGPGSYTGLRVGMATAKGLCFAGSVPLITLNTLEVMAAEGAKYVRNLSDSSAKSIFLVPMIDARRMEVFAAVYDLELNPVLMPAAVLLEEYAFEDILNKGTCLFFGSGSEKLKHLQPSPNAEFTQIEISTDVLATIASEKFAQQAFADVAYSEPVYLKEFYTQASR